MVKSTVSILRAFAVAILLAGSLGLSAAGSPARADEPARHFVFSITTDEGWAAGSALTQATVAAERGHRVTVLLSVRGVHLAEAESAQGGFSVTARTPREMLAALIRDGHAVLVCGMCMVAGGVATPDLIEGATVAGSDLMFNALAAPDTVVLSY
ncbi:MAG: DsrE family protein [Rubrimonas sp.]|uniref:DsrE family protein n=1 Tax=Rubrimonas sp. TaxID=2036015 RepID=UPI002FDEF741